MKFYIFLSNSGQKIPGVREASRPRHLVPVDRADPILDRNLDREVVLAVDPETYNFGAKTLNMFSLNLNFWSLNAVSVFC